jgi:hypothetical protein
MDTGADERQGDTRLRRRRAVLLGIVIVALLGAIGGLLISTSVKSPADLAAQSQPPGLTRLTVTVRRQVITSTVLAQGVVSQPAEVSGPAATGGGAGSSAGAQPIVTRIFLHTGSAVPPGSVILEVAGRPLFVFAGTVPAYRNLVPGESGEDVAQLQTGLELLGFGLGNDTSGVYGPGTATAVAAFYRSIGYPTPMISTGPKADRGAMMPLSEFMFVPRFPAHLASIGAKVGETASGKLITLSMGNPAIAGQLNPGDRGLVRPGMKVTITDTVTGKSVRGRVTSVRSQAKTKHSISGGIYLPMRIRPSRPLRTALIGQNVSLTITAAHSAGPVLAVPEAAIFASVDGSTYVTSLGISSLQQQPAIFIGGQPFTVIGIIASDQRLPQLNLGVTVPTSTALRLWGKPQAGQGASMLIHTRLGAAQVVAGQVPIALRPDNPKLLSAAAPPSPTQLKHAVTTSLNTLFLALAGIALVVGAIGIANTTLVAVLERTSEIGLRRALGARPRHIGTQFLTESTALGLFGGLVGASLGVLTTLVVTIYHHWTALLDPRVVLAAPVVGGVVGLLAGLYPALRASTVEPADALRR